MGMPLMMVGGLAVIGVYTTGWGDNNHIPSNSPQHPGEFYIKYLGTTGSHALTIVGYNDNIWIKDINNDGQYTNNQDVNNDGTVNILDYEKGAFKVANSWGTGTPSWPYCNAGFSWLPYHLFYPGNPGFSTSFTSGGVTQTYAYSCDLFGSNPVPETSFSIKVNLEHECRNSLKLGVGYGLNSNQADPTSSSYFLPFTFKGGCDDMRGTYDGPIELGLNFSYFYDPAILGKVFFTTTENDNPGDGTIHSFSLVDHRWGEEFELPCTQTNVPINNGTTTLAIKYHLLPHHNEKISYLYNVTDDRVSRFTTEVEQGGNLVLKKQDLNIANIDMYSSTIHIHSGAAFTCEGNSVITAKQGNCSIIIDGSINLAEGVTFKAEEGASLEVIFNSTLSPIVLSKIKLYNTTIKNYSNNITIESCEAYNFSSIHSYRGNVTIQSCAFEKSNVRLENFSDVDYKATLKSNTFNGNDVVSVRAIFLYNYGKYEISANTILHCDMGMQLMRCGNGAAGNQVVKDNYIHHNILAGILAYNTTGKYTGTNYICNNGYGVQFYNTCNVTLNGNPCANNTNLTQNILDNQSYEIFATQYGFPPYCKYNVIRDDDNGGNPSDPIVYYENNYQIPQYVNVSRNCWGNNFNANQDLKINSGSISYLPTACPPYDCNPTSNNSEQIYMEAQSLAENGECVAAVNLFKDLIDNYPNSEYTMASMKSLSRLAGCASLGYDSLYNYFITADSIINDSTLKYLGEYLANDCNIALQKWPEAIEWYENQILDPQSPEDSLFAIIDLGNLYLLMQNNGLKQSINGKLTQFKPENEEQYFSDADYYLSLLPFKKDENNNLNPKLTELYKLEQNTPNPFNSATTIKYSLSQSAIVKIVITDMTGRVLFDKNEGNRDKGNYTVTLNNLKLEAGNYLYSIYLNDKLFDTKKMTVIK